MLGLSTLTVSCEWPVAQSVRSCFEPNPEAGKATGKHTKALSTCVALLAHRKMCSSGPCAWLTFVLNLEVAEKARVTRKAVCMRALGLLRIYTARNHARSGSTAPILPRFSGVEPRSGLPDACVLVVFTLKVARHWRSEVTDSVFDSRSPAHLFGSCRNRDVLSGAMSASV